MVDPITEKLYSTKAEEVQFIREQVARGRPILDAISELIQQSKGR
jgi:conjugal transfer ATP-binding protein TraC